MSSSGLASRPSSRADALRRLIATPAPASATRAGSYAARVATGAMLATDAHRCQHDVVEDDVIRVLGGLGVTQDDLAGRRGAQVGCVAAHGRNRRAIQPDLRSTRRTVDNHVQFERM